jgi:hypothetical protein
MVRLYVLPPSATDWITKMPRHHVRAVPIVGQTEAAHLLETSELDEVVVDVSID